MRASNQKPFSESGTSPPLKETRRQRFNRLFPSRVEKLIEALRILEHCSKPHCDRNQVLTEQAWIAIGKEFEHVAKSFGVTFQVTNSVGEVQS